VECARQVGGGKKGPKTGSTDGLKEKIGGKVRKFLQDLDKEGLRSLKGKALGGRAELFKLGLSWKTQPEIWKKKKKKKEHSPS